MIIVVQDRASQFGDFPDDEMALNDAGQMVETVWLALLERFPTIELDAFVNFPNHVNRLIVIGGSADGDNSHDVGATLVVAHTPDDRTPVHQSSNDQSTDDESIDDESIDDQSNDDQSNGDESNGDESTDDQSTGGRAGTRPAPTDNHGTQRPSLGALVGAFKSSTTHAYIQGVHNLDWPSFRSRVW